MTNKLLLDKNLHFPHISLSLLLSCLIISIAILFNDVLYAFLGANAGLAYPWQYLTSVFAHGPEPSIFVHLTLNFLLIIFLLMMELMSRTRIFLPITLIPLEKSSTT